MSFGSRKSNESILKPRYEVADYIINNTVGPDACPESRTKLVDRYTNKQLVALAKMVDIVNAL